MRRTMNATAWALLGCVALCSPAQAGMGDVELIQERYPNASIKIEREVTQDDEGNFVNHGYWKHLDESGTMLAEGQYVQNKRDGVWSRWYRGGESNIFRTAPFNQFKPPFVSTASFKEGELHGVWGIHDANQRIIMEVSFVDGERHGPANFYNVDGTKLQEANYVNGLLDGEVLEYARGAKQPSRSMYIKGRKLAAKVDQEKGGRKKSEGVYLHAPQIAKSQDSWWDAQLAVYEPQGKDERHGKWITYYSNGQIQVEGEYEFDVPVGRFIWWYPNGQKAIQGSYVSGKEDGRWLWWHENGLKKTDGAFKDGVQVGHWMSWNPDGRVASSQDYPGAAADEGITSIDEPPMIVITDEDGEPMVEEMEEQDGVATSEPKQVELEAKELDEPSLLHPQEASLPILNPLPRR
ncbi:hypothetical protein LOC68_14265 [Blastopirellula sp. JC732]|uniref:MORN repeat variant n=1 Tax=Blastopirellula sediminis TaxID=2894196 RepID=A0A9X1MQ46_9BACT|nr:hypothetical protein [Blastopirellula sediminis]MCC9607153.1 hypothetical protein [Blastopirellula sediminis]MCC9629554.1 hypothetical protein [Blastopirellula sediminis]